MIEELEPVMCGCGCGEIFKPVRNFQRFVNDGHRQKYWRGLSKRAKDVMVALGPEGVKKVLEGTYQ